MGKYKVLSGGFCLRDSEAEQRALPFLHIYYSNVTKINCNSIINIKLTVESHLQGHLNVIFVRLNNVKTSCEPN